MTDTSSAAPSGDTTVVTDGGVSDATGAATGIGDNQNKPAVKLFKVPVGKDNSGNTTYKDFTEEDLIKHAGLGLTAHERFEQAKKLRADMTAVATAMKDPKRLPEVLEGLGHDRKALLNAWLQEAVDNEKLDPKDRDIRDLRAKLTKYEETELAQKKIAQAAREKVAEEQLTKVFNEKIDGALKDSKLSNNKANRAAIAQILLDLWNAKDKDGTQLFPRPLQIPNEKITAQLRTSRMKGIKDLIEGADDEGLLGLLDPDFVEKITTAVSKDLLKKQGRVDNTVKVTPDKEPKREDPKVQTSAERDADIKRSIAKAQAAWERRNGKR